jgi:hypothetical protein
MKAVDAAGKSLVRENWWLGDYAVHHAPPGSRSVQVPTPAALPPK